MIQGKINKIRQDYRQLVGNAARAFAEEAIKVAIESSPFAMNAPEAIFNRLWDFGGGEGVANDGCHDDEWEDECLHYVMMLV